MTTQIAPGTPRDDTNENDSGGGGDKEGGGFVGGWKPAKSKTRRGKYICKGGTKVCGNSVSGEDSIQCEVCEGWFHPRCQELSIEAFQALTKYDLFWLCMECRTDFKHRLDIGKQVVERIDKAEQKILKTLKEPKLKEGMEEIQEKISKMEKEVVEKINKQHSKVETTLEDQKTAIKRLPEATADISANKTKENDQDA